MTDIPPSEILRQIHRLSAALTYVELTVYQKQELEGALYALTWVLRHETTSPVEWMLPKPITDRVDELLAGLFTPVESPPEPIPSSSWLERSQPVER